MSNFQPANSDLDNKYQIVQTHPKYFKAIQELCKKVYPFSKPWSIEQLESHCSYFPDGQLLVVDKQSDQVMGFAFSLIIFWEDYSPRDNWEDFTSSGFFHNHNPKRGKTLYGAEIMVDPACRGQGIGKMLYRAREELVEKYGLKRIRAGARLRGYSKYENKLSPQEYVRQVVQKKVYDPTLSFQLNQGFVALSVAKNYLFNDPESLGFASVIEWLNPKRANEKDYQQQKKAIEHFLTEQTFAPDYLPKELRKLVRKMSYLLGDIIKEMEGAKFYDQVENYRRTLKKKRNDLSVKDLLNLQKKLLQENAPDRLKFAHAFSVLLEVTNCCESAYRTLRQRISKRPIIKSSDITLTYVLTAHPTEARSKFVVELLGKIQETLLDGLQSNFSFNDIELKSHLKLLWTIPLIKSEAPSIEDEAEYIYSLLFSEKFFDAVLAPELGHNVRFRTWVGGDKDGHPGVTHQVMLKTLEGSRNHLLRIIEKKLKQVVRDIKELTLKDKISIEAKKLQLLLNSLKDLKHLKAEDGRKVRTWIQHYESVVSKLGKASKSHYQIELINRLLEIFPALVLPLELREDSQEISKALQKTTEPIAQMLAALMKISNGIDPRYYARGLVISHCETAQDMVNAKNLILRANKYAQLPIIPLFESREALKNCKRILTEFLSKQENFNFLCHKHGSILEIMLGYSDSAKEVGMLASRYLIKKSMFAIERLLAKYDITPIFFHGSGGSSARGGGNIREQISWWPQSAILAPKMTIQGEMVQRLFSSKEIFNSHSMHLCNQARIAKVKRPTDKKQPLLAKFIQLIEDNYRTLTGNKTVMESLLNATPYEYLDVLKIGSRPSKRSKDGFSLSNLRAIPWVLCWTQTRLLLPTWWGVGSAWEKLSDHEQKELREIFLSDPYFSSSVKTLCFSLAKVNLSIWAYYSYLADKKQYEEIQLMLEQELKKTTAMVASISGTNDLMWFRPWLGESIRLRSPYIHFLNVLQGIAMQKNETPLLKETMVGIASGMLTTG